jgi:uncharacterized protein (TIGR04255 family)
MESPEAAMKMKFKNPPIRELVIGLYFDREVREFRAEHIGLFWSSIREEFPTVSQQPIVAAPGAVSSVLMDFGNEFSFLPRFWLEAKGGDTLMQIQKNAFLFNWRKRENVYPHYDSVKRAFDTNFSRYHRFLEKELGARPNLQIAELTYINVIESCEYWQNTSDTAAIFPRFKIPIEVSDERVLEDFSQVTTEKVAADLSIHIAIRAGRSTGSSSAPALAFEFRAIGLLGAADKGEADAWFDRAHDAIGRIFTTSTSSDIQERYWQAT